METFLVTVKLPRGHAGPHDPANKVTGPCPISGAPCGDVTGEHHSTIVRALHAAAERVRNDGWDHITRVEQIVEPEEMPVHLLERAAVVCDEYGWSGLAATLRLRISKDLSHQTGPYWHVHRFEGQVLRHAHAGPLGHGYYDHPEEGKAQ